MKLRSALPRSSRVGSEALMLDCGTPEETLRVFTALSAAKQLGALEVDELVHAESTVLVKGGIARDERRFLPALEEVLRLAGTEFGPRDEPSTTVIPVQYDGMDLADTAEICEMSVEQLVQRHLSREYTVAFIGYSPGFAYLSGGDPLLVVPRRDTPRRRVSAGSLGLAGTYSSVYPREGPGGWQIIGRTDYPMWDLDREPPAALMLGAHVRFETARPEALLRRPQPPVQVSSPLPSTEDEKTGEGLLVIEPGLQTLLQDTGRPGLSTMGVGAAGAADRGALRRANRLVGNHESAVAVELSIGAFKARAQGTLVLALTGAPRRGRITGPLGSRPVLHGSAFRIDAEESLELSPPERGVRTVLALRGGVQQRPVLHSASRDTLANIGPEPLAPGDLLRPGPRPARSVGLPEEHEPPLPATGEETEIEVVLGPRAGWFDDREQESFLKQRWRVTSRNDRVGVRLNGDPLVRHPDYRNRELPSEGLVVGSIQVPPDGQPVLFLVDHPLTGGYPVIAVVVKRHLDLVAQLPAGSTVRFVPEQGSPR